MNIDLRDKIDDLNQKLKSTSLGVNNYSSSELQEDLSKILVATSISHSTYIAVVSRILKVLEWNKDLSRNILINNYLTLYGTILSQKFAPFEKNIIDKEFDKDTFEDWKEHLEKSMSLHMKIRVSDFNYNSDGLSSEEKLKIISMNRSIIQKKSEKMTWDDEIVNEVFLHLSSARSLLDEVGESSYFYFMAGNVMDRYHTSQLYQNARDFGEELVLTSFKQDLPYWGFYMYFKCYTNSSSAISALLYGNLSIISAINYKDKININYAKEIIWESIKLFRNIGLPQLVESIYQSIPNSLKLDEYSKRSISHSYFTSLLVSKNPNVPTLVLDFLNKNREQMLSYADAELMPWLLTLFNIEVIYFKSNFKEHQLYNYLQLFESIVPFENYSATKAIIYKDLTLLKIAIKEALIRLRDTRYRLDFVNDNNHALIIASKIIEPAQLANDAEAILLAMIVKTDYTYVFIEQSRQDFSELKISKIDLNYFKELYWDFDILSELLSNLDAEYSWIINSENKYINLRLSGKVFSSIFLLSWQHSALVNLFTNRYFSKFRFDETVKRNNQIVQLFEEDHIQESQSLTSQFSFVKIDSEGHQPLYLILDMNVSEFPHNLFLDHNGDFIYLKKPISNIISTEWYLKYANKTQLSKDFSKSIWIPTEGDDFTILRLFSNLEQTLRSENFRIEQGLILDTPISSEVNILVSHGAENIAFSHAIYPDENPRINVSPMIGSGKVLILFVCHSGSVKATPFENSVSTLIKTFLSAGYTSIIAPVWALHADIPPIWLPMLLDEIHQGKTLVHAVHKANLLIYNKFPTIAAWACMHLYGDPHINIDDK